MWELERHHACVYEKEKISIDPSYMYKKRKIERERGGKEDALQP